MNYRWMPVALLLAMEPLACSARRARVATDRGRDPARSIR